MKTMGIKILTIIVGIALAVIVFAVSSCRQDSSFSFTPYEGDDEDTSDVVYEYDTSSSTESESYSDDYSFDDSDYDSDTDCDYSYSTYDAGESSLESSVGNYCFEYSQNDYSRSQYDEVAFEEETFCNSDVNTAETESDATADEEYATDETEDNTTLIIDSSHDYAENADIRTNEVLFDVRNPVVGATEATIKAAFTNYRDAEVSLAGCTVYDDMGNVIGTNYGSSSYSEKEGYIEFNLKDDLGLVLESGRTYYYNFVVEVSGELFTHKQMFFRTNDVDDRFAFELLKVRKSEDNDTVTLSAKVFNPTGAHVKSVGYYAATIQGAHVANETISVDTSETEFVISFDINGFNTDSFFGPDYDYTVSVNYEGEKYTSYMGYFSVPK